MMNILYEIFEAESGLFLRLINFKALSNGLAGNYFFSEDGDVYRIDFKRLEIEKVPTTYNFEVISIIIDDAEIRIKFKDIYKAFSKTCSYEEIPAYKGGDLIIAAVKQLNAYQVSKFNMIIQ